jgi:hypothetical protein
VLLLQAFIAAATLVLLDSRKVYLYAIHVVPYLVTLTACSLAYVFDARTSSRRASIAIAACVLVIQLAGTIYTVVRDSYDRDFLPAAREVVRYSNAGQRIMAAGQFAFVTGFDQIVDDPTLGYRSGLDPDVVVLHPRYRSDLEYVSRKSPDVASRSVSSKSVVGGLTNVP